MKYYWPAFVPFVLFILMVTVLGVNEIFTAVETTTIQGKVILPDGTVATSGKITATLSQSGTTPDTTTSEQEDIGGREEGTIGVTGDVTLVLVPNDAISPSGTFYTVRISVRKPLRASWLEKWKVDTSPDPVDIGAITRLEVEPGIVVGSFMKIVATEPSGICTGNETTTYAEDTDRMCECVTLIWECGTHTGAWYFGPTATDCNSADVVINAEGDPTCNSIRSVELYLTRTTGSGRPVFYMQEGATDAGAAIRIRGPILDMAGMDFNPGGAFGGQFFLFNNTLRTFRMQANTTGADQLAFLFSDVAANAFLIINRGSATPLSGNRYSNSFGNYAFLDFTGANFGTPNPGTFRFFNAYANYNYYCLPNAFDELRQVNDIIVDDDFDGDDCTLSTQRVVGGWKSKGGINTFPRNPVPTKCNDGDRIFISGAGGAANPKDCCCDIDQDADGVYEICDGSGTAC